VNVTLDRPLAKFAAAAAAVVVLALSEPARAQTPAADESRYYSVDFVPTPPGAVEVGGMDFLPDGRLVVSTRHGQVWIVENALAKDPKDAKLKLFAEGLYEGLGLKVVDGQIYVVQRTELSRLRDTDGDGRCDTVDTICGGKDGWGVSGNYHEFAYGLPRDAAGNWYVSLNVSFFDPKWWHGKSPAKYRGWIVQIAPNGELTPFASGFRSPNGMCITPDGDLFCTDNQGDWMPSCPLFHVKKGEWYGHPASLEWTDDYRKFDRKASDTEPPEGRSRKQPAIWIPYGTVRSAGNPLVDTTGGKFGPFGGQMFVAELTNACVMRADLEKVGGEWQGAILQFRRNTGSANRVCFAPDGTMFVGLTNRGWGGAPPADGIARVRWTGRAPMEMQTVRLLKDEAGSGFDVGFTLPIAASCTPSAADVSIVQYDYNSWWDYGSPEMHVTPVEVTSAAIGPDRRHLRVHAPKLAAGMCARIVLRGVVGAGDQGDEPLLHPQADYTVNRLIGMTESVPVAKTVPPPPTREDLEEGWVTLFDRRSMDGFDGGGAWKLAAVHMDPADPSKWADHPLVDDWDGMLVNSPGGKDAVSQALHGDCDARVEFMVTRGSNSGVYFQGRYELQILDSFGRKDVGYGDCGGIYEGTQSGPDGKLQGFPGSAPKLNACNAPGEWQRFDVRFRAPRFDASGKKVRNARFDWVKLNGQTIQEDVELTNPTRGGFDGEVAYGPLRLQGDHGPVAFKKVRLKQIPHDEHDEHTGLPNSDVAAGGWTRLFDGKSLDRWTKSGDAVWSVEEGAIVGRGKAGLLTSGAALPGPFELRAKVMIHDQCSASCWFRANAASPLAGYRVQVNGSDARDAQCTGSLYNRAMVAIPLVRDDLWFDLRVRCVDEEKGTHVTIWVNDVVTADHVDAKREFASGKLVLDLHDDGKGSAEVRFKDVEVRPVADARR
jgi:glucose/arabinose dehydrogenase